MLELQANLWDVDADCRVITTNGFIKKNGEAVMGRGCALEAAQKWPDLPAFLGRAMRRNGNVTMFLYGPGDEGVIEPFTNMISLPVKHHWREKADLALIFRSVVTMIEIVDVQGFRHVVMPRPGCGNGGLDWDYVRPPLAAILDDRFTVVHFDTVTPMTGVTG